MFSFKRDKEQYDVLKVFKVVDLETAKSFETKKSIDICLKFLKDNYSIPTIFDLNYGHREWHSFQNFEKGISKFDDEKIVDFSSFCSPSKSMVSFSNGLLNDPSPALSYINITIAIKKSYLNADLFINLLKGLHEFFEFDYAYGLTLSEDYEFGSEKKIKKSFFGLSVSISVTKEDIDLEKKKIEFKNGYVGKIYPFNVLNKPQLESTLVNQNIENGIGILSDFNQNLILWRLNENDLL